MENHDLEKISSPPLPQGGLSTSLPAVLPFEKPQRFIDIPDAIINTVSKYMTIVIDKGSPGREVDITNILNNSKNMFRDGVRYNDKFWLHHCASSIREIISFMESGHFTSAFRNIPERNINPVIDDIFSFLDQANAYLSDIVHFRESAKIGSCEKLYPKQGYGEMKKEDFLKSESTIFERVCIDIVYTLNQIFSTYCQDDD